MKLGVVAPIFEDFGDAGTLAEMAAEAEAAGWEGFFIWDSVIHDDLAHPIVDPWVALAAIALSTRNIRIGTIVTPVPRRRPWKLARETTSIDRLSGGRMVLGVGLGDPAQWEYGAVGEDPSPRIRAEKLDEGLDLLSRFWSGERVSFQGTHFRAEKVKLLPTPIQQPRIPVWVGGLWPHRGPMSRAARWDGACPVGFPHGLTLADWKDILGHIRSVRGSLDNFDAVHIGVLPIDDAREAQATLTEFENAGITWWLEDASPYGHGFDWRDSWTPEIARELRRRIGHGPPDT